MKNKRPQVTIHANANQHEGYWQLRITVDRFERDRFDEQTFTLRESVKVPLVDSDVDQAWVLLVTMLHALEKAGAVGRVRGADWPALW
jgi:hypothetical protein